MSCARQWDPVGRSGLQLWLYRDAGDWYDSSVPSGSNRVQSFVSSGGGVRCSIVACFVYAFGVQAVFSASKDSSAKKVQWESLEVGAQGKVGFQVRLATETGVTFANHLEESSAERNRILENGSGVAAGDVDGDGRVDLYFCRLEGGNVLYRNLGDFRFVEVEHSPELACSDQASTGAMFVDLEGDGDLDLLVSGIAAGVRAFLNDGEGRFSESSETGFDRDTGSMSLALADADEDGDLDLYVTNYQTVTWKDFPPGVKPRVSRMSGKPVAYPKERFLAKQRGDGSVAIIEMGEPDALYLNQGDGRFEKISWTSGHFLDEAGLPLTEPPRHWGLSVAFRDFNGDGRADLYVCNDFLHGNDDFFLNQGAGVFRRISAGAVRHSSWSSMAVDVADINRDGHFDFFVADMLSQDLTRRLTQRANNDTGVLLRSVGVVLDRPQEQHNSLYLNRGDGSYVDIAQMAGVEASEWSWNATFLDVDLDGYEDLLIGNGHGHDLLDGDVTIDAMRAIRSAPRGQATRTLLMYPRLELRDLVFRNRGDETFEDLSQTWGFETLGISSALCRADLDQDGDWDVVINRLQAEAVILENTGSESRIKVRLHGEAFNPAGAGALVRLLPASEGAFPEQRQELTLGGRYLSCDEPALVFAGGALESEYKLDVVWPGGEQVTFDGVRPNRVYDIPRSFRGRETVPETLDPKTQTGSGPSPEPWFKDVSEQLQQKHVDRLFNDLERQPLLPRLLTQLGPGVNWADLNDDGYDDLLVTGGLGGRLGVLMNDGGERFKPVETRTLENDQMGGIWFNVVGDVHRFAIGQSNYREARRSVSSVAFWSLDADEGETAPGLSGQRDTVGPIVCLDYDQDGDLDLFVGGRVVPGRYPESPLSRLFRNEDGRFHLDVEGSRVFYDAGMVSGAVATDFDGDGDSDLSLAIEWGAPQVWRNDNGTFQPATQAMGLDRYLGWWNGIAVGDFDEDGRMDWVATNWGRNTKYERYRSEAIRLAYGDVDGNGTVEVFEHVYDQRRQRWGTIRDLIVMGKAVPSLQGRVRSYTAYAEQGFERAMGTRLDTLPRLEATWLESTVFLNRGDSVIALPLPREAQRSPAFGVVVGDFDGDGHEDLFLAQNFFATQPETPRYDGGMGLLLQGRGDGQFTPVSALESGVRVLGEQRGAAVADYDHDGRLDLAVTQNGAETRLFQNHAADPAHRIRLHGPSGNRQAIGAKLRLDADGLRGPLREIRGGGGYWSQDGLTTLWPVSEEKQSVIVTWPHGGRSRVVLEGSASDQVVAMPDRE